MAASPRPTNGSAGNTQTREGASTQTQTQAVLHLRGVVRVPGEGGEKEDDAEGSGEGNGRSIKWAEGTVDNEGLGRKKSKGIYLFISCLCLGLFLQWSQDVVVGERGRMGCELKGRLIQGIWVRMRNTS